MTVGGVTFLRAEFLEESRMLKAANNPTRPRRVSDPATRLFWIICLLAGLAMLAITTSSIMLVAGFPFHQAIRMAASLWGPYFLITPLVFGLCQRLPINQTTWKTNTWIHLLASVFLVTSCEAIFAVLIHQTRPELMHLEAQARKESPKNYGSVGSTMDEMPEPGLKMILMKAQFGFPLYWVLVALAHALQATVRLQERERQTAQMAAHLSKAQLAGLRTQLQPHFLFNTLNSISALIPQSPKLANEMLMNLSDLLRMTLRDPDQGEITLVNELNLLGHYVDIQRLRFGARLTLLHEVDEAAHDLLVPPMLLQPIVENAIRYGIEPSDQPETIVIKARVEAEQLWLEVTNTCHVALEVKPQATPSTGLGLENIRNRLRAHYGENQGFTAAPLQEGMGFCVQIRIPAHSSELVPSTAP